jgi:CheY-like chemotaxis protein
MADLLIVDDDLDVADLLAEVLQTKGHACRVARNGREGLELVATEAPDLVLLDVEMPVLDGPEMVYELFLRDRGEENIPVILTSGIVGLPRVAARVGTPYFVAKPYTVDSVLLVVARALEERIPPRPAREA